MHIKILQSLTVLVGPRFGVHRVASAGTLLELRPFLQHLKFFVNRGKSLAGKAIQTCGLGVFAPEAGYFGRAFVLKILPIHISCIHRVTGECLRLNFLALFRLRGARSIGKSCFLAFSAGLASRAVELLFNKEKDTRSPQCPSSPSFDRLFSEHPRRWETSYLMSWPLVSCILTTAFLAVSADQETCTLAEIGPSWNFDLWLCPAAAQRCPPYFPFPSLWPVRQWTSDVASWPAHSK